MKRDILIAAFVLAVFSRGTTQEQMAPSFNERLVTFEAILEDMRQELKIPGMSASLVKDREVVWAKGFGHADLENKVEAAPDTAYFLASLTKTFASTILMQLVEGGELDLDDPVGKYGIRIKGPGTIRIRHLFSHTSEGIPGSYYKYDGGRFAHLGRVIKRVSRRPFESLLMENIVQPLSMNDTVPGNMREEPKFRHILAKMAKPYALDGSYRIVESKYPTYLGVSAGLVSTVQDMARYVIAIDKNEIISRQTQQNAFKPQVLSSGTSAPYALGWFVQEFEGARLIWHYGFNPRIVSTLILYAPDQGLAFIIFANTDCLSRPFWLGLGDVLTSPAAVAFVKYFVTAERAGSAVPEISWNASRYEIATQIERAQAAGYGEIVKQELISRFMMLRQFGDWEQAKSLLDIYTDLYTRPLPEIGLPGIASIESVQNDQYRTVEFVLKKDAAVRVYSVGESDYYRLFDFGGIEDASTGRLIWRMRLEGSEDAGGALKNRRVDQIIELPRGTYRLHYKTDAAHSFARWNDIPPDELYWGISLYLSDPAVQTGDTVGEVGPIQATSDNRLLDAVEFSRGKPPISSWEYFALMVLLIVLASAIVFLLARVVFRRADQKPKFVEPRKSRRRWMLALAWVAGINAAVCLLHTLPALLAGRLEGLVASGVPLLPGFWWPLLISLPLASGCMVAFLIVAVVVSWRKNLWDRPERIYYTLVVIASAAYLVLLNHWRVIILPA